MIRVLTESGPVELDAEAKDVTATAGHLKIHSRGILIAQFRDWSHWYETEGSES